ncbi:hypothetical protein K469DRAFT_621189 [Zopfia rhizophila CBS 207.26]|uniref:Uncharacterized protein n=1 Tax=Zopfia rhizophila CBS 207.26 TaxID=1314779 RepID=A0A6A6ENW5_9PEZI|nr:hypothetical protein K469DRAFT_621189 [Zopfia rhizophila CBS 207.26]
MSLYRKREDYGFSCSSGGQWYACGYGSYFVGCCGSDPCKTGCSKGNLQPASFDEDAYSKFPDANCPSGSEFYTCALNGDTFLGCCKSKPCKAGFCPKSDLEPAYLGDPNIMSQYSATGASTAARSSTATSRSSRSTSTAATTLSSEISSTASPPTSATPESAVVTVESKSDNKPVAAIAGGAAGGGIGLAVIIGLLIYHILHAKRSRKEHSDQVERRLSDLPTIMSEKPSGGAPADDSAPPGYSSPTPGYVYQRSSPPAPPPQSEYDYYNNIHRHELPAGVAALSPTNSIARKPISSHRLSELSGETARISELESPQHSPNPQSPPQSPRSTRLDEPNWMTYPLHSRNHSGQAQAMWISQEGYWRDQPEIRGYPGV